MSFWQWFQQNGDKVFTFVSVAAQMLHGVDGLSPQVTTILTIIGILATAAHQNFFPATTSGVSKQ